MSKCRIDFRASRQVKDPAERELANMALRKFRDNLVDQTRRDLTLNLVNSPTDCPSLANLVLVQPFQCVSPEVSCGCGVAASGVCCH